MHRAAIKNIHITSTVCIVVAASFLTLPIKWVFAWLCAVAIHELGHLLALYLCGVRIRSIQLDINGACIESEQMENWQELVSTVAGPLLGALPMLFSRVNPYWAVCSMVLTAYNLLPLYPLDGGRIINCIMAPFFRKRTSDNICKIIARSFLVLLSIGTVALAVKFNLGCILPLICVALIIRYWNANPSCKENKLIVQ